MTKVVINSCYGGFGLSHEATMEYGKRLGFTLHPFVSTFQTGKGLDDMRPVTEEEAKNAFLVFYYKDAERKEYFDDSYSIQRNDPILIQLIEEWGSKAVSSNHANLEIVDVPDDAQWEIAEYDGMEHVAEKHRVWP